MVDRRGRLTGILPVTLLLTSPADERVGKLVDREPISFTAMAPEDDVTNLSPQYEILASRTSDRALIEDFMTQTREWTARGISVYSLYMPAYEPRAALEDSLLGFDRDEFRLAFEQAGGLWLDVGGSDYVSYDGSHLEKESALKLSRAAGLALAAQLKNQEAP